MLDYEHKLNKAQYKVVSAPLGPMLVVAGAGTGKTRTIVWRLAWLVEHGIAPHNILLLTFTRKAAKEMLDRATGLLGADLHGLYGGTFHAFAYRVLRQFKPLWLGDRPFSVMDSQDQQDAVKRCREESGLGRERGFPKTQAIVGLFSKARNKEKSLDSIILQEQPHILLYAKPLAKLYALYGQYKQEMGLLDYDDLLYEFEKVLVEDSQARDMVRANWRHILVDEYQDTNLVQARIVRLMAGELGENRSVMAVGDEAQSIYAFRGATVRNILEFPDMFAGTRIVALEENYRSVQPVLNVANRVMSYASEGYEKTLTAVRTGGKKPRVVCCDSDTTQARCVAARIANLLQTENPWQIAVLFRSGYQSYQLEGELVRLHVRYKKYGGLRYQEAAHVKDLMAYLHFIVNPGDQQAFQRIACMHDRIGPRTAAKLFAGLDDEKACKRYRKTSPELFSELDVLAGLRGEKQDVAGIVAKVMELYEPHLQTLYPTDFPTRKMGLQELHAMAQDAQELDLFVAEILLDSVDRKEEEEDCVTLSTIHSAKGLEWKHVFVIDLVNGKLPSRFAQTRQDIMEEERRLMYVACTRAKDNLELYWYKYQAASAGYGGDCYPSRSTFLDELGSRDAEECVGAPTGRVKSKRGRPVPLQGSLRSDAVSHAFPEQSADGDGKKEEGGDARQEDAGRVSGGSEPGELVPASSRLKEIREGRITRCTHRIFGEGRIVSVREDQNLVITFPVHGTKTIMASYVFVKA